MFVYDVGYFGLGLNIPIFKARLNTFASFSSSTNDYTLAKIESGFSAGAYVSYPISFEKKKKEFDHNLTHIVEPESRIITPNEDGKDDIAVIHLTHSEYFKVRDWNLVISEFKSGKAVSIIQPNVLEKKADNSFSFPSKISWAPVDYKGEKIKDGKYQLVLLVIDMNGEKLRWNLKELIVDRTKPDFNIFIQSKNLFLQKSKLAITLKDKHNDINEYVFSFEDKNRRVKYSRTIINKTQKLDFSWSGNLRQGVNIESGIYNLRIQAQDHAGNKKLKIIEDLHVYDKESVIALSMPRVSFSPNNDKRADTLAIAIDSILTEGIKRWKVKFVFLFEKKKRF